MATNPVTYYLGILTNSQWHQHSNAIGQIYYVHAGTGTSQTAIPQGYQDMPTDTWALDTTKTWPQWNNSRTGRAVLINPIPPAAPTYLDDLGIQANIILLQRVPESKEHMYRRLMGGILQVLFLRSEGYSVVQETNAETIRPDFTTLKVFCRPARTLHLYEFLIVESKSSEFSFEETEPQCEDHLKNCSNESKNTYGMIQCGLQIRFYKHENYVFQSISPTLHLVDDARGVMDMIQYLKDHPMSFI
ncbi:MAG: hypothetical protein Q9187_004923 [Circinaria calcarea]